MLSLSTLMEKVCWNVCLLLCCLCLAVVTESDQESLVNYVTTAVLPDGEKEIRMRFGDVILRETFVTHDGLDGVRRGLMLRQVASGPHFLQLIYKLTHEELVADKHRRLAECEVVDDWSVANKFRSQFKNELLRSGLQLKVPSNGHPQRVDSENYVDVNQELSRSYFAVPEDNIQNNDDDLNDIDPIDLDQGMDEFRNVTVRMLIENELSKDMKQGFDIQTLQKQCKRLHRKMKQAADVKAKNLQTNGNQSGRRIRREAFRVTIMPGTLWCGDGSLAEKYESVGAHVGADRCCREHDGCPFIIDAMSSKFGMFNYRMHTISHCTCDERKNGVRPKRELPNVLGLSTTMPGTQWCGRGYSATELTHLGGLTGTDKCCRYHDLGCPFYIEAFEEKYGLFNWRMYTVNHCACDERFRSCLKQTNTGSANFVGKIFFNVVQTKCFLLKPERTCSKVSWWGKCLKHEYKKQAHLRDPIPY